MLRCYQTFIDVGQYIFIAARQLREDCRNPQKPDNELREYWTKQKKEQEQTESTNVDYTDIIVSKKKKSVLLLKNASDPIAAVTKKTVKAKENAKKGAPKSSIVAILVSDDEDNHKRKLDRDLHAIEMRERELKRREEVLLYNEKALTNNKPK